ncbi:t-SNARE [Tricharina praecox]|uniref:t-SNARE n=1 Tax=Tricharina praecox TaxID=43433 RepID=UPI00221F822E|nr:t-SNARE [Tricharina praecox]KAI5854004.1 t-SNARE [Tricharina praecox]
MDSATDLFTSYESDFKLLFTDISQRLHDLPTLTGESRKASIRSTERSIDEADEIIGQMSLEINNIPSASKTKPRGRLRNYTSDLDSARGQLVKLAQSADRDALLGVRGAQMGASDQTMQQRQQLLGGTQSLERSSARLRDSERIAIETEQIGAGILGDLSTQRESIVRTHDTLNDSERYLDRSIKTLRGMARRMATNRMITIAIITVLVLLIFAVIFSKFH